jgi:universal stress protein A
MVQNYKKILLAADLLPTDDNPVSERALEIARLNNAELHLVHVIEPIYTYGLPYETIHLSNVQGEQKKSAEEKLFNLAERLGVEKSRAHLFVGTPKEMILQTAEEIKADLILIGNHARHGIEGFLLGSTANDVLRYAECDVTVVRIKKNAKREAKRERSEEQAVLA